MMSTRLALKNASGIVAVMMAMPPASALADGLDDSTFSFGGFGTLGAVHSNEHQADFTTSFFKPNGAGYSDDWSFGVDSLIAAQASAKITPKFSATLQILAQQNYNDTYWPHVEWADVKYEFTPELSVRVGRTVLPTFLVSDVREVGYANPWLRPPVEVYGLSPITSSDGVDVSYRVQWGNVVQTFAAAYGYRKENIPLVGSISAKRDWIIADTAEFGAATLHAAYQRTSLSVPYLGPLFAAFREFGTPGEAIAERYDAQNKIATFVGFGGMYDPGRWFATGEWGRTDLNSVLGTDTGWYVSGGYRVAKVTPYLTYGRSTANNLTDPGLSVSALPPGLAAEAMELNATLNSILETKRVESTVSAGARWDFVKNCDFKLQFDRTRIGAGSTGELINVQPAFRLGAKFDLISFTVDFVF